MIKEGTLLWEPSSTFKEKTNITAFMNWLESTRGLVFADYHDLWRWSVDELESFWQAIWDYFEVQSSSPYRCVLESKEMPGAKWFPGARVNFAQHVLRQGEPDKVAIYHQSENRPLGRMTWRELTKNVLILANELRKMGVQPGDRIAAYLPNTPEAVIALLASVSIGAVWSICSPDFGSKSVLDRLQQIEPKILFAVDGYKYGGKTFDRREEVRGLKENLPSVDHVIYVPYFFGEDEGVPIETAKIWHELLNQPEIQLSQFQFEDVLFEHPLWVLYSSGTTGIPKGMVHSHGGILLEMYKTLTFHINLGPESCLFFYTTTGWMVFNVVVSGLLTGSAIVLYDGNPGYPDLGMLWQLAEKVGMTVFGASPTYVNFLQKAGLSPATRYDLSQLEMVMLSGLVAGPEVYEWVYQNVKKDVWLASQSGGTDIASAFVGAIPTQPVYAGEIQVRNLGVDVQSFNHEGKPVIDEVGELVVTLPMPSMPIYFWNDKENKRYLESYYETYPGIWRHGDSIKITSRGTCVIYGRSDSTLNRHGVRIGTSEIYSAVETIDEIMDSLIVNLDLPQGRFYMPLFVVCREEIVLDEELKKKIAEKIRTECSPRHVPDQIYQIQAVPYTLTGKKMEVPVRKILMGVPVSKAASRDAMANPDSLDFFVKFAATSTDYTLSSRE